MFYIHRKTIILSNLILKKICFENSTILGNNPNKKNYLSRVHIRTVWALSGVDSMNTEVKFSKIWKALSARINNPNKVYFVRAIMPNRIYSVRAGTLDKHISKISFLIKNLSVRVYSTDRVHAVRTDSPDSPSSSL